MVRSIRQKDNKTLHKLPFFCDKLRFEHGGYLHEILFYTYLENDIRTCKM